MKKNSQKAQAVFELVCFGALMMVLLVSVLHWSINQFKITTQQSWALWSSRRALSGLNAIDSPWLANFKLNSFKIDHELACTNVHSPLQKEYRLCLSTDLNLKKLDVSKAAFWF